MNLMHKLQAGSTIWERKMLVTEAIKGQCQKIFEVCRRWENKCLFSGQWEC